MKKSAASSLELYRKVLIISGVFLFLLALLGNKIGLSRGSGVGYGQMFVLFISSLMIFAAITGSKFVNMYKSFGTIILNTFILFALLEFTALITVKIIGIENIQQIDIREQAQDLSVRDTGLLFPDQIYHPFVMWRSSPVDLPLMNVSRNSIRKTYWVPDHEGSKIITLGGSAMWGWMVPDSSTIPSYIQRELNNLPEFTASVSNHAQNGWVSTQEITELILLLRAGYIPDLVVFYNGANDVFASFENGRAGLIIGNANISRRLSSQGNSDGNSSVPGILTELLSKTNLYILINHFQGQKSVEAVPDVPLVAAAPDFDDSNFDVSGLANETAALYLENYRIVDALSMEYGFDYYFFLQPLLCLEGIQRNLEELEILNSENPKLVEFVKLTYNAIMAGGENYPNLVPVEGVFTRNGNIVFTDLCHINASGNEAVASWIVDYMKSDSTGNTIGL